MRHFRVVVLTVLLSLLSVPVIAQETDRSDTYEALVMSIQESVDSLSRQILCLSRQVDAMAALYESRQTPNESENHFTEYFEFGDNGWIHSTPVGNSKKQPPKT